MTRNEYNGWTNYETWVVKLWMDNDKGSYDHFRQMAKEYVQVDGEHVGGLAEAIKEEHEEMLPRLEGFGADLLGAAMSEVNWHEIAQSLAGDYKEELTSK